MTQKRYNVTIKSEVYEYISKIYQNEKSEKSLTQWISDKLILLLDKEKFLKSHFPDIENISAQKNSFVLRDKKLKRLIEVTYKNGKFMCDVDKNECCIHVKFVLSLPEVTKVEKK